MMSIHLRWWVALEVPSLVSLPVLGVEKGKEGRDGKHNTENMLWHSDELLYMGHFIQKNDGQKTSPCNEKYILRYDYLFFFFFYDLKEIESSDNILINHTFFNRFIGS